MRILTTLVIILADSFPEMKYTEQTKGKPWTHVLPYLTNMARTARPQSNHVIVSTNERRGRHKI